MRPRTVLLACLLLAPLVLAPAAEARPPKAITNLDGVTFPTGAGRAAAVALDAQGVYAYVGLRPDANTACGASVSGVLTPPVPCRPDLAGFDLDRGTALASGTQAPGEDRPSQDVTLGVGVAVTPADAGAQLQQVYVVKAGPGNVVAAFRAGNSGPQFDAVIADAPPLDVAAITKDNTRFFVGGGDLQKGILVAYVGPPSGSTIEKWRRTYDNTESVRAIAVAKDDARLVVGTTKAVYVHTNLDSKDTTYVYATNNVAVNDVDVSDDGAYAVAGLANGDVLYFAIEDASGSPSKNHFDALFSARLSGSVNAVAISGDGKRFAAATAGNEFAMWRGGLTASGPIAVQLYKQTTALPLSTLDGARTGTVFVGAGTPTGATERDGVVYGFTPSLDKKPAWAVSLTDPVVGVALSADGNQVVAASETRFYAWAQTSDVLLENLQRERTVLPNELVRYTYTLTNAGSLEDNYTITVNAPFGWFTEGERQSFVLAPDAQRTVEFAIKPPATAEPTRHMTRIEVFSQGTNAVVRREFINVTLQSVSNLRILSDQGTTLKMNQGEELPYLFKIVNQGNSYARLNITVSQSPTQGPPWTVTFPEQEQNLTQGEERSFTATVVAPRDADDGTCNTITILAKSGSTGANLPVTACINPQFAIGLQVDQPAVAPKPGETAVVKVRVENRGNTKDTIKLETTILPATAALDWRVSVSPTEIELAPRGVRTATVSIRAAVANPPDVTISLRASSAGDATPQSQTITAAMAAVEQDSPAWGALGAAAALAAVAVASRRRR